HGDLDGLGVRVVQQDRAAARAGVDEHRVGGNDDALRWEQRGAAQQSEREARPLHGNAVRLSVIVPVYDPARWIGAGRAVPPRKMEPRPCPLKVMRNGW